MPVQILWRFLGQDRKFGISPEFWQSFLTDRSSYISAGNSGYDLFHSFCQLACVDMRLAECDEETRPIMRLLYRSRCACLWELVDDPDSSRAAWWLSVFLKMVVFINMFLSQNSLGVDPSGPT